MIEYLESATDTIAVKIEGRLSRDEISGIADRIEQALVRNDSTHIFAELSDFQGFDWKVMGEYLPRAIRMLAQRDRVGRIAVVTDHGWIRWATRLESALIPGLHYETFHMKERDQALAWVEGRSPYPHGQALTLIETTNPDVIAFELSGRIGAREMHDLAKRIIEMMERRPGKIRILGKVTHFDMPALGGIDAEYLRMKLKALARVERYALVGGPFWLTAWIDAIAPLLKIQVRHFPADQEAEAWEWLGLTRKSAAALAS